MTKNIGRRPSSSEPGPQNRGPTTYPSKNTVVIRYETSLDVLNECAIGNDAAVGAEDAKVLNRVDEKKPLTHQILGRRNRKTAYTLTVMIEQIIVIIHLYWRDQF